MTEQSPSDRLNRASNEIFEATSFLNGTNAAYVEQMYAAGANTYIEKPQEFDRFVQVLQTIHGYWLDMALLPPRRNSPPPSFSREPPASAAAPRSPEARG